MQIDGNLVGMAEFCHYVEFGRCDHCSSHQYGQSTQLEQLAVVAYINDDAFDLLRRSVRRVLVPSTTSVERNEEDL